MDTITAVDIRVLTTFAAVALATGALACGTAYAPIDVDARALTPAVADTPSPGGWLPIVGLPVTPTVDPQIAPARWEREQVMRFCAALELYRYAFAWEMDQFGHHADALAILLEEFAEGPWVAESEAWQSAVLEHVDGVNAMTFSLRAEPRPDEIEDDVMPLVEEFASASRWFQGDVEHLATGADRWDWWQVSDRVADSTRRMHEASVAIALALEAYWALFCE